ncbi:Cytochrome P450 [Penicillium verhagenii]|nr:Cytochrome P450 [Penicillium verhagenii]
MSTEIPGPPGIPILGNIFDVNPNETWSSLNKLASKYGPIFKINVLGNQLVFICSVALLDEICDQTRFRKCVKGPVVEIRYSVHDSLFTADNDDKNWGIAHRIMMPLLTKEATDSVYNDMMEVVPDLTKKWSAGTKQRVKASDDLDLILLASCMKCFFNERVHVLGEKDETQKKAWAMVEAWEGATMEALKRPNRPKPLNWLYQGRFSAFTKTMRNYATEIVNRRKNNPELARKDMMDALLNGVDPESGLKLTDSQVVDEIISIFIGAATAANLLTYAVYYLSNNPEALKRGQEEIDSVVGEGPIDLAHLKQLNYVEAILRETIRLSAAAPGFNIEPIPRKDKKDKTPVLLGGGEYQIPYDQPMLAILSAVNRDPAVFEDPLAFNPEQVIGDKWDKLPAAAKKGFGNGKRECIGKLWAWQWSFFTLASILKDVTFELEDPNYELQVNGAFSIKPMDMYVLMSGRHK